MTMDAWQRENYEKSLDNIYEIQHTLTMQVNNAIEDFVVRSVQEYGNNENIIINAKKIYEACKKQTPMQIWGNKYIPVHVGDTVNGLCPICNTEFVCTAPKLYEEREYGYCKQCGQKLAWDNPTILSR